MSTLTLLRHGQAAFGAERYDELSALGAEQARATGAFFAARGLAFSRVICGPRQRHQQTARLAVGGAFEVDAALDEFAEGEQVLRAAVLRTGLAASGRPAMSRHEQLRLYAEQLELWAQGRASIDGVLPPDAFRARASAWLSSITAAEQPRQHLLAVTSAGVIAALVCEALRQDGEALARYMQPMRNASITTLLFSGPRLALQDFNASQHLPLALVTSI
ncbi:histidine phosphatase family protein [Solimonas soli]|uniref:histidine phosphatase family protein n=1 Tax=Solimonas soli TaxID=413479 RepID=UPI000485D99E|nr:histidine phosphatase family protein [Solimonas soli]